MSEDALLVRVRQIVATTFETPLDEISPESSYMSLEKWDSMGHLMLILEVEQEFNVQFAPEQAESMTSVAEIVKVLKDVHSTKR